MFLRTESDAACVAQARKGDVEAFNRLIARWEKRLYNYLLRLLRNREDALDVCQDAFLKAYRSLGTIETPEKFPQWLFRIAHNLAFSQLRRDASAAETEYVEGTDWTDWADSAEWDNALARPSGLARSGGQHHSLHGLELELAVAKALESLSPEQREAVVLKVYHGFQFAEIAEILGCPQSTVKSRLYTALSLLKEMLTAAPDSRSALHPRR